MADDFKKAMHRECGVGGLKCPCCNKHTGKDKPKLDRIARRGLKHNLDKLLPDDKELCDDCGEEFDKKDIKQDTNLRTGVVGQYCKLCMNLHESYD